MNPEQMELAIEVWEKIKEVFIKVLKALREIAKVIAGMWYKLPGYRRKAKALLLAKYKAMNGKSNNWRKMHSLPLARNSI